VKTPARPSLAIKHATPNGFQPGTDLSLSVSAPAAVTSSILWYRHVNQGERWLSVPMQKSGSAWSAVIPGKYSNSPFPLQYYFELRTAHAATLHPILNPEFDNQPYFALMPQA
jgi:hypothetical protein